MADILIRGMEMPKTCGECRFSTLGMECVLKRKSIHLAWLERRRPDFCPLVELPEHGDLIDRNKISFVCGGTAPMETDYVRRYYVDRMPAIVPSNRE